MDIDIDFPTSYNPKSIFPDVTYASMIKDNKLVKHPAGVYFQKIPTDSVTNLSAIPYDEAENLNYTKIDFLHLSVLDAFNTKEEVRTLLKKEPNWDLLKSRTIVEKLFQIGKHFDVIDFIQPTSVQDLADCIALIRPGKKHLIQQYDPNNKERFRKKLYAKDSDTYSYKKGHAISYAMTIVLQLHLIQKGLM